MLRYKISFTPTANNSFAGVEKQNRKTILNKIKGLKTEPEKQGKPLSGPLKSLRSIRSGRYRIIYKVERSKIVVLILVIGMRKESDKHDIYAYTKRLIKLGLLEI